jgi:uncharacterized membrane protein YhhN
MTEPRTAPPEIGSVRTFRPLPAFTPYAAVSLAYLVAILVGATWLADALKPLLMPTLILALGLTLMGRRGRELPNPRPRTVILVLAGLALSWAGDVALGPSFVVGLGFFLAAHLCYIAAFWLGFSRRMSWWGLVAIPWFAGLLWALAPALGELLPAVAVYGAVLGFMAVSATRGNLYTILGGLLFVASDSMLAFRMFTPVFQSPPEDAIIMLCYLLAQLFIVVGVLASAPRPRPVELELAD